MLYGIYAESKNGFIGNQGKMPWYLPRDLAYFKAKTINHIVVMGRKTFKAMGDKPLPNRENILLTRDKAYYQANIQIFNSPEEARVYFATKEQEKIFIIGGAEIFKLFWQDLQVIYRTVVLEDIIGDTKMPKIDQTKFQKIASEYVPETSSNDIPLIFETWQRI